MHRWWQGLSGEHYWMEITDRPDVGVDLNAPQLDERGRPQWTYELLRQADDGDVVFHFHKEPKAIVAHSIVRGDAWQDQVVWGAKGTSARGREVTPYPRPGYRRALQQYTTLETPVTLEQVRSFEPDVFSVRDALVAGHGNPLYFPFVPYSGQALRTFQGYFVKFPGALAELLGLAPVLPQPELSAQAPPRQRMFDANSAVGVPYRRADESVAVSDAEPMQRDPALVERGLLGHRATQNGLADLLAAHGFDPLSPAADDPDWDLAWRSGQDLYVAEIKSLTEKNEERQLRLGLGQVLRYRQRARSGPGSVIAVLVVERRPSDEGWPMLCDSLGVRLVWPGSWSGLVGAEQKTGFAKLRENRRK